MYPQRNSEYVRIECLHGSEKSLKGIADAAKNNQIPFVFTSLNQKDSIFQRYFNDNNVVRRSPHMFILFQDSNEDFEVLEKFKATPVLRRVPIIVLSQHNDNEFVTTCYNLGANALVPSPKDDGELSHLIKLLNDFWIGFTLLPNSDKNS